MEESWLENFLVQFENGLFKPIDENCHFELGMHLEPNIQKYF